MEEIKPSKEMWRYYNKDGVSTNGITIDLILSSLADILYGWHISYSATELLKDLGLLTTKGSINKKGKYILSTELHARYHRGENRHILINPFDKLTNSEE